MAAYLAQDLVGGSPYLAPDTPNLVIACTVGAAAAAGVAASVQQSGLLTINCSIGAAQAYGVSASVQTSGSNTINCSVGSALAAGVLAAVWNVTYTKAPAGPGFNPLLASRFSRPPAIQ